MRSRGLLFALRSPRLNGSARPFPTHALSPDFFKTESDLPLFFRDHPLRFVDGPGACTLFEFLIDVVPFCVSTACLAPQFGSDGFSGYVGLAVVRFFFFFFLFLDNVIFAYTLVLFFFS